MELGTASCVCVLYVAFVYAVGLMVALELYWFCCCCCCHSAPWVGEKVVGIVSERDSNLVCSGFVFGVFFFYK